MSSDTYYIIGTAISESESHVQFCWGSDIAQQVNAGLGINIDQTNFVSHRVSAIVDDANLDTSWMADASIEQSY